MSRVLIIGGGVMGCAIGLRLRQAGKQVLILERAVPGAEASSAAAGMLAPQMEADGPGPFFDLCMLSKARYPAFTEELEELSGMRVDYLRSGLLHVAFNEAELPDFDAQVGWQQALGLRAERIDAEDAWAIEPELSREVVGASWFPDDHQLDNRLLVRALSMAAARVGVRFRTGNVREIVEQEGRVVGVDIEGELLRADHVVLAAGSWSGLVQGAPLTPQRLRPARGQMVVLHPRVPPFKHLLKAEGGYLVPRRDGRVIAGTTMELAGFEKSVTARGLMRLLEMALRLCPALEGAPVGEHWAGLRPYTDDRLPIIGPGPLPGLFLATGHFRNGILLAPITAELVTACLTGEPPAVDLGPFRLDRFPAGG
ncbi:MAG TPA: glycine oxidase ThiO [Myxococcaceae bacterium]|nr:glycine oxidase ThiO [Myxococcaceae bacterium]